MRYDGGVSTRLAAGLLAALALSACRYSGTFECATDTECRQNGATGHCQPDTLLCAFDDATCTTGLRYGDAAGDLSNQCIPDPVDAGVDGVDALFDVGMCPAAYTMMLPGVTTARYALLAPSGTDEGRFKPQVARCEAGLPGATHPAIIDSAEKAAALVQLIGTAPGRVWVGAVQSPTATQPINDWLDFMGQPVPPLWASGQPDDANGTEADHSQQGVSLETRGLFDEAVTANVFPVLCECDGRMSAAMPLAYTQQLLP